MERLAATWECLEDRWTCAAFGGRRNFLERADGGWQVWTTEPGRGGRGYATAFFWYAEHLDEVLEAVEETEGFWRDFDRLRGGGERRLKTEIDGHPATARWSRGQFDVVVWSADGNRPLGHYTGGINNALSAFVLGQTTIQGSRHLDETLRGRGIGAGLVALAEEVSGLRAVPHGSMGTDGVASEAATRSWQAMAARKDVPGFGDDGGVRVRASRLPLVEARRQMRFGQDYYGVALRMAAELGYGVTAVALPEGRESWLFPSEHPYSFAFPTRDDGSVVSIGGRDGLREATVHNLRVCGEECGPEECEIAFLTPDEVAALVAGATEKKSGFVSGERLDALAFDLVVDRERTRPAFASASPVGFAV